jgi:hypothetical protein
LPEPSKTDKNLLVKVINDKPEHGLETGELGNTPTRSKHSDYISKATEIDRSRLKKPAELKERKKLAAAYNLTTVPGDMTKRQLNLYSERRFIEEYKQKGIQVYTGLEDPLDDKEKDLLHENWRREGATRRASTFIAQFTLGNVLILSWM